MNIPELTREEITDSLQSAFERLMTPVVDSIGEMERLKRREYLTPEEVELLYGLKASTLANKRTKAAGPRYTKDGGRILYPQKEIQKYLNKREILTNDNA